MFKLVAIGGKLRGTEYVLENKESTIGRDSSCEVQIELPGISKNHFKITTNVDTVYIQDLGSANGTIVDGKITKQATLKNGQKIAIPNIIFQLVHVKEKKVIVKKKIQKSKEGEEGEELTTEEMPKELPQKILYIFKHKIMPIYYSFNQEYEWRSLLGINIVIFIVCTISLTIFPVLVDNKNVLLSEIKRRGFHYAEDIARLNAVALERKDLDRINTNFLANESGVESYELFDLEGRIVRPISKLNEFINDPFSIEARDMALDQKSSGQLSRGLDRGKVGIAKTILAYNFRTGREEAVGIIAIKFAPISLVLEAANNKKAYLEAFTTSLLVGIFFFAITYYLSIKQFDELNRQVIFVQKGKAKEIVVKYKMLETKSLITTLNNLLHRIKDLESDGDSGSFDEMEDDSNYVRKYVNLMESSSGAVMILNSEKLIKFINNECEDLVGIRQSVGEDMGLLDVARDQGFAASVIEICDACASNNGEPETTDYELGGVNYKVYVNAAIGKDNYAKAYYISFVNNE